MTALAWMHTVLFAGLFLAVALHLLAASGHFPAAGRLPAMRSRSGSLALFGSIAVVLIGLLVGLWAAARTIPWYAAVIAGGGAVLLAPLLLIPLPDWFVNGRRALLLFALLTALFAGGMGLGAR